MTLVSNAVQGRVMSVVTVWRRSGTPGHALTHPALTSGVTTRATQHFPLLPQHTVEALVKSSGDVEEYDGHDGGHEKEER